MRRSGSYYGATAAGAVSDDDREQARALGRRVARLAVRLADSLVSERAGEAGATEGGAPALPMAARIRALLAGPPWVDRPYALTLLGVEPPEGVAALPQRLWLILDVADARDFDDEWREPLLRHRLRRIRDEEIETTVATTDGVRGAARGRLAPRAGGPLGVPPRRPAARSKRARGAPHGDRAALPPTTRWSVWRARSTCRQGARWRRWTARMPRRGIRAAAHRGRSPPARRRARSHGWPASWRRARTRRRTGSTPPPRQTALGRRIAPWLDALTPAVADSVLGEAARALRAYFADREWLREPEIYALRPPPRR